MIALLHHPRHATREASNTLGRFLVTAALLAVVWVLRDGCNPDPAWAAVPKAPPAPRWSPAIAERTRQAWPTIARAAALEGVEPALLAATCAYESGMLPIRGGRGNRMLGPCQVDPAVWLPVVRRRHGAGLVVADLLGMQWGLVAGAVALRASLAAAGGDVVRGLCRYAAGNRAAGWQGCRYARGVVGVEAMVRRDLGDLVEERV